jgi:hypothetical protein
MIEPEVWHVPPGVLEALQPPQPRDEIDELIDSAGQTWPVHTASWSESL